jgi:hypothetical protein
MKKNLTVLVITVAILVLLLVSFFGVWYTSHVSIISGSSMGSFNGSSFLTEGKVIARDLKTGTSVSNTYNYNDIKHIVDYQNIPGYVPGIFDIYNNTFYIVMIIILISVLVLISNLLSIIHVGNKNLIRKVVVSLSLLLIVISILTTVYFVIHYTLVQNESIESVESLIGGSNLEGLVGFWSDVSYTDSTSQVSLHMNSGPGYAWYLMIIVVILSIISYCVIRKNPLEELSINDTKNKSKKQQSPNPPKKINFCRNCGVELEGYPGYCFKCGYKLR